MERWSLMAHTSNPQHFDTTPLQWPLWPDGTHETLWFTDELRVVQLTTRWQVRLLAHGKTQNEHNQEHLYYLFTCQINVQTLGYYLSINIQTLAIKQLQGN